MLGSIDFSQEQSIRKKPVWSYLILTSATGVLFSYSWVKSPALGIAGTLGVLLVVLCLGLGMRNFLLFLILIRINLDAFHNQLSMSLASYETTSLPGVLGIFVLCVGGLYLLVRKVNFWSYPLVKPFAFFLSGCLLSLPFSRNLSQSLTEIAELLSFVVLFVLIVDSLRAEKDIRRMVSFLVLSSLVPLSVGLVQVCSNFDLSVFSLEPSFRVSATLTHPNAYAFYLVMIIVLSVSLFIQTKSRTHRSLLFFLITLLLVSLVFTYTRSAWIGLALAVLGVAILKNRKLLIVAPLTFYGLMLAFPFISLRFDALFNPELFRYTSLAWRIELWSASIPYFLSHPIFGNGFGTFQLIGFQIDDWSAAAHNDYLRLLVETGIIGLSGFLILLVSLARLGIKAKRKATDRYFSYITSGFVCFLSAYVLMSFTDNLFNHGGVQWYFWAYAGVIASIIRLKKGGREGA
jgi:putative inorganic carbon (HCO3(-)) transporter